MLTTLSLLCYSFDNILIRGSHYEMHPNAIDVIRSAFELLVRPIKKIYDDVAKFYTCLGWLDYICIHSHMIIPKKISFTKKFYGAIE